MAGGAELSGFLEAAGRSLAEAQGGLGGGVAGVPTAIAISEAELEVKTTVETQAGGGIALTPVSSQTALKAEISPGTLSTVRIRYVAVADDSLDAPSARPTRTQDKIIDEVKRRDDLIKLDKILGGIAYEALFIPTTKRWLVTAKDPGGNTVRELVVADAGG